MHGLLLALLVLAAEPPAPPADRTAALTEARRLVNAGKPDAALEALRFLPLEDAQAAQLRGVAHYHANHPLQAVEILAPVVARLPEGSLERREAVQVLGLASYLAGRIADAIPYLEQTRAWAADNPELSYVLGMAYVQTRRADKARETWARSFGVPPASAAAHLLAAQMMVRAELDELADAELKQALALDPRLPRANFLLGQTALFRGRLDEAIALFKRELEINPGDAMAFYRLGDAYTRQLKWDEARAALQKSIWINPFYSGPYILLGKAYMKQGDTAAAEGMLRQAIGYDPNNKAAHYLLGQLLQQAGRAEEARRELEIAERLPGPGDR
jgi:tetratricopeptide (TPR) repeat protein